MTARRGHWDATTTTLIAVSVATYLLHASASATYRVFWKAIQGRTLNTVKGTSQQSLGAWQVGEHSAAIDGFIREVIRIRTVNKTSKTQEQGGGCLTYLQNI
jgi:hypothetical protein